MAIRIKIPFSVINKIEGRSVGGEAVPIKVYAQNGGRYITYNNYYEYDLVEFDNEQDATYFLLKWS